MTEDSKVERSIVKDKSQAANHTQCKTKFMVEDNAGLPAASNPEKPTGPKGGRPITMGNCSIWRLVGTGTSSYLRPCAQGMACP